ncbi:CLC_0170 family protein [Paenibacillus allorhizosphaerae]|uniref:Uncharacterized protein n=1 Tax=Paenibacillus allorhizosphaerae TaxID=2849866 RepID=A0ABM8VGF7_9BACL|nr:CLC_0170 family protein [Paenibacillus allorhizosphaerae]CAG7638333.1 hypothetical protein PAECIP111802_02430 [Paenibacillus allorhizosphaerae]
MIGTGSVGYLGYAISLWLVTGVIILRLDVKGYELSTMMKEKKVARFVGWLNVCLGFLMLIGYWSMQSWEW